MACAAKSALSQTFSVALVAELRTHVAKCTAGMVIHSVKGVMVMPIYGKFNPGVVVPLRLIVLVLSVASG
jgi:hypothetical protein